MGHEQDRSAVDTPASPAAPGAGERPEGPSQGPSTSDPPPPRNIETARREGFDPED